MVTYVCIGWYDVSIAVCVVSVLYSHCPYAVVARRCMALVVECYLSVDGSSTKHIYSTHDIRIARVFMCYSTSDTQWC